MLVIGFLISTFLILTIAYPIGKGVLTPLHMGAWWDGIYVWADYGWLAILFGVLIYDTIKSWNEPSQSKAAVNVLSIFGIAYLWAIALNFINPFLPFYQGEMPITFSLLSSGFIPYLILFFLVVSVIFNVRPHQV